MPIIDVTLIEGRTKEVKAALIHELTDAAERAVNVPRNAIRVILREVPPEHFGVAGVAKSKS
jgi:4-oxalocrotonate tautomerase